VCVSRVMLNVLCENGHELAYRNLENDATSLETVASSWQGGVTIRHHAVR
jgi:hypothetical protein